LRPLIPLSFTRNQEPKSSGTRAKIVADLQRRIWGQHDESLEAFEERLAKAAADVARTQDFPTYERCDLHMILILESIKPPLISLFSAIVQSPFWRGE
jgi:hypothetical protein